MVAPWKYLILSGLLVAQAVTAACTADVSVSDAAVTFSAKEKPPTDTPISGCVALNGTTCGPQQLLTAIPMPVCEPSETLGISIAPEASGASGLWDEETGLATVFVGNLDSKTNDAQRRDLTAYPGVMDESYDIRESQGISMPVPGDFHIVDSEANQFLDIHSLGEDLFGVGLAREEGYSHYGFIFDVAHGARILDGQAARHAMFVYGVKTPVSRDSLELKGVVEFDFPAEVVDQYKRKYTRDELRSWVWHATIELKTGAVVMLSQAIDPDSSIQGSLFPTIVLRVPFDNWKTALRDSILAGTSRDGSTIHYGVAAIEPKTKRLLQEVAVAMQVRAEGPERAKELLSVVPEPFRGSAARVLLDQNLTVGDAFQTSAQILKEADEARGTMSIMDTWRSIGGGRYGTHETASLFPGGRIAVTGLGRANIFDGLFTMTINGPVYWGLPVTDVDNAIPAGDIIVRNAVDYIEEAEILPQMQGFAFLEPPRSQTTLVGDAQEYDGAGIYTTESFLHGAGPTTNIVGKINRFRCRFKRAGADQ